MTALAPLAPSLYDLEQDLMALLDTEAVVSPAQELEFRADLALALEASIEKRDRVGQFIRHCELQRENCEAEVKRLQERKRSFETAEKRIRVYVQAVIEALGPDAKGKMRKLEGKVVTFSLRTKPGAVDVVDDAIVPNEYKSITITLPVETWQLISDEFRDDDDDPIWTDMKRAEEKSTVAVSKTGIKAAFERGEEVPGADLSIGGYSLVVR